MDSKQTAIWRQACHWVRDHVDSSDAERQAALAEITNPDLLDCIKSMLAAESSPMANVALPESSSGTDDGSLSGRSMGPWQLGAQIGRGGMGAVYAGSREGDGVSQQAAIKVLSIGLLGSEGAARFQTEQQVLAGLSHPHIARLLDWGVAEDGTPWMAMQRIRGVAIDTFCKQQRLDNEHVVRLMLDICSAVSDAHSRLIVHRDIKPSNIMVECVPGQQPRAILLDFGLAKLLAEQAADQTSTRAFTPRYASPEQQQGATITTATDVFGLGKVLDELTDRGAEARRPHDLNNIIAMATRPDPERRYQSTAQLGDDLRAWLERRPVRATPDSRWYRLRTFVCKHRWGVAMGSTLLVVMFAALGLVLWQANTARIEAERANSLADFVLDLFVGGDLLSGSGPDTPVGSLMEQGAQRARIELATMPEARAEILRVIGQAQIEFGQYDLARENLQAALDSASGEVQQARLRASRGLLLAEQAEFYAGIADMEGALEVLRQTLPSHHSDRLEVEINLINFLLFIGEPERAMSNVDALLRTVEVQHLSAADHANLLRSRGMVLIQSDRLDEAIEQLSEAITLAEALTPPRRALVAAFLNDLGIAHYYAGNTEDSINAMLQAYLVQSELYGADHKRVLTSGSNLLHVMRAAGQLEQGVALGKKLVETSLMAHGQVNRSTVLAQFPLALLLSDLGRDVEALATMNRAVDALRELPDMRAELPNHLSWLAEIMLRQGLFAPAIAASKEAETLHGREFPDVQRRFRVAAQRRLVQAHAALGQCESAQHYYAGIADEIGSGAAAGRVATNIYLLSCNPENQDAVLAAAQDHRSDAGVRQALVWFEGQR